nr:MAG TPA: hypothetical protein [Caudoviricetes sp.]
MFIELSVEQVSYEGSNSPLLPPAYHYPKMIKKYVFLI